MFVLHFTSLYFTSLLTPQLTSSRFSSPKESRREYTRRRRNVVRTELLRVRHGRVSENPGVLAAAALRRIDHQRIPLESHAGQSTRQDENVFGVKNVGAQID